MGIAPRPPDNEPYSKTFNPGWRNHPNFGCGAQGNQGQRPYNNFQQPAPPMQPLASQKLSQLEIAKQLSERPPNTFPNDTITNPREACKAIKLISGKTFGTEPKDEEPAEDSSPQQSQQQQEITTSPTLSEKEKEKDKPKTSIPKVLTSPPRLVQNPLIFKTRSHCR
ncbi:hypothetical protein PIB30_097577 [Stylosanthes scabra]|uniref:Uncharacterized protein n=1 Tax=Stylosanthes scabra TaxID=79078 RepID=A0ABU6TX33_9FABA|nr:hypothetical protein [Stylosanthes scabra]